MIRRAVENMTNILRLDSIEIDVHITRYMHVFIRGHRETFLLPSILSFLFSNISNVGKNWVNGQSAVLLLFSNYSLVLYHYYSERYLGNSYSGFPFVTTKNQ